MRMKTTKAAKGPRERGNRMYYFTNGKAGSIIDEYLEACGYDCGDGLGDWQDKERELHSAVKEIAEGFGPCILGDFKKVNVPKAIAMELTDGANEERKVGLADAFYMEAADLYKGYYPNEFRASLKIALFDLLTCYD